MKKKRDKTKYKQSQTRSSRTTVKAKAPGKRAKNEPFYIVGMGSSAGGLEAFEQFFTHIPADSGMAFVLVPHLDPTHKGMMPELLQRVTKMPVFQADDGMKVLPNHVYTIPPNKDMSILNGTLQLLEPVAPRGLRLPIDYFFRQLAEDRKERAVGIILSGMGTDGTLGIKSIKEKLGMVMAQDVRSAKYDSMPRSAIATGLVDYIAPVEELPGKLLGYTRHLSMSRSASFPVEEKFTNALQKINVLLRDHTGNDFSCYKRNTLVRRIERRMGVHQITDTNVYIRYLRENPNEIELLFKELLIGVTSFFRETEAFDVLRDKVIPLMLKDKTGGNVIRVWVPGCSTGEEAYSLSIILRECLEKLDQKSLLKIQIFATDIDKDAINKARQGIYPLNITANVSPERLQRFFVKEENCYQVKKEIRETVIFAPQNVIMDPPFTKLDLISCRNVLIYMTAELQRKLLLVFHYALNPGGFLFLGNSETIGTHTDLFSPLDNKYRIFRHKESALAGKNMIELPLSSSSRGIDGLQHTIKAEKNIEPCIPSMIKHILIEQFTPPAAIINAKGDILYINGRTGKYLEPPAGKTNINIFAMAREGLRDELGITIRSALAQKKSITLKGLKVRTNGNYQSIDLTVKPFRLTEGHQDDLLLVVFQDVAAVKSAVSGKEKAGSVSRRSRVVKQLEEELAYTREKLQMSVEERETFQEEIKSTNEELQSSNEELQSTNEELMTSKEELQSMNEELVTVNSELQTKIEGFARATNDMQNLINNIDIATIFLDNNLNVRRFTPQARKIINMISSDVDRSITHFTSNLKYEMLFDDIKSVIQTLIPKEIQVQTKDGCWYLMRIMPYQTADNIIDGVVVVFVDIAALKQIETLQLDMVIKKKEKDALQESIKFMKSILDTVREPLIVLDAELRVVSASRSFYHTFQVKPGETEKQFLYELGGRQWDIPALKKLLKDVLTKNKSFDDYRVAHNFPNIGRKVMLLNARRILREGIGIQMILLAIEDISEREKKSSVTM